jgi:hypothetical protein
MLAHGRRAHHQDMASIAGHREGGECLAQSDVVGEEGAPMRVEQPVEPSRRVLLVCVKRHHAQATRVPWPEHVCRDDRADLGRF